MKGLLIKDELRWHARWSSEIGRRLKTRDSSNNLFVFEEGMNREEILAVIGEAPAETFQILELEEVPEEECEFKADSGLCYRRLH